MSLRRTTEVIIKHSWQAPTIHPVTNCLRKAFSPWFLISSPCCTTTKLSTPISVQTSLQYRSIFVMSKSSSSLLPLSSALLSLASPPITSLFSAFASSNSRFATFSVDGRKYTEIDRKNKCTNRMSRRFRNWFYSNAPYIFRLLPNYMREEWVKVPVQTFSTSLLTNAE